MNADVTGQVGKRIWAITTPYANLWVDPGLLKMDADDLYAKAKKIYLMSSEERRNMGFNGRKFMEECFDREIVVRIYKERIRQMEMGS